jgi:hypothetical protein
MRSEPIMNTSSTAATPTAPRPALHGLTALVVAAAGLLATGCGGTPGNRVSGAVTFDGRPVPAGKVYFKPDTEAGNTGATGFADIVDGRYDTGRDGARNVGTGAMVISVEGIDPHSSEEGASADVTAKVLFQGYEIRSEIPGGAFTLDIAVPAEAAAQAGPSISP